MWQTFHTWIESTISHGERLLPREPHKAQWRLRFDAGRISWVSQANLSSKRSRCTRGGRKKSIPHHKSYSREHAVNPIRLPTGEIDYKIRLPTVLSGKPGLILSPKSLNFVQRQAQSFYNWCPVPRTRRTSCSTRSADAGCMQQLGASLQLRQLHVFACKAGSKSACSLMPSLSD